MDFSVNKEPIAHSAHVVVFLTSTYESRYLLVGQTSQGSGSGEQENGSDSTINRRIRNCLLLCHGVQGYLHFHTLVTEVVSVQR